MMSHTCDILQEANENGGTFLKNKKRMHCKSAYCKNAWKKRKKAKYQIKYGNVRKPLVIMFSGHLPAQHCIC